MRANHVLPIMLAGAAGCLDLQALQSDAKDAALPPVEDMGATDDLAAAPADLATPTRDMVVLDMTTPPTNWIQQYKLNGNELFALHGKTVGAETTMWTVGEKSKEAHYTTTSGKWTAGDVGAGNKIFRGLWAASEKEAWAVGEAGLIYKGDNAGKWTAQTSNTTANLSGIYGNNSNDILVSSDLKNDLTAWNGTAWGALNHAQNASSNSIWITGNFTFAPSSNGVALRGKDRMMWVLENTVTGTTFNTVTGIDEKTVYIAGVGGNIAKWDNANTKWVNSKVDATGREFLSIWAVSASEIWAVGKTGMAYRGDGTAWTSVGPATLATHDLKAVWGDAKGVYVLTYEPVGKDSYVFKY